MRYAVAILLAIAVVTIAHDTTILDESIDLLQESATVESATVAHAKVAVKSEDASKVKEGAKAALEERATVMIGTHELDAEQVSMAKHALSKITMKLGVRHPIFLGEAAGISDFTSDKAKYVKGGYKKLAKILEKVDDFTADLELEKQTAVDEREKKYADCEITQPEDVQDDADASQEEANNSDIQQTTDETGVANNRQDMNDYLAEENAKAKLVAAEVTSVSSQYTQYWDSTEERHQVRNVLMQALWLVCTGFATFRHTQYCTNIRQQPDFDEPSSEPPTVEDNTAGAGLNMVNEMISQTTSFENLMQPVWEQQKVADASAANSLDGDVDMEKGFVNNRAPWGVDPEGMDSRATSGQHQPSEEDRELGESNEAHAHDMTNEEMSSRLTFLVESSSVPERISVPITAFIQALDSDDTAVQGGLVEALVKMDTAEGQAQSNLDYAWYSTMESSRQTMHDDVVAAQTAKQNSVQSFTAIEVLNEDMKKLKGEQEAALVADKATGETHAENAKECDRNIIEIEALIEVCNEELTNIMRLNSLLRFLIVGDAPDPASVGCSGCSTPEKGSCTWRNRGGSAAEGGVQEGDTGTGCEDETGRDIPCKFEDAYPSMAEPDPATWASTFCACEYGFYGLTESNCDLKSCSGYGRIRYPGNAIQALQFDNKALQPTGLEVTAYPPLAVCSGIRLEEHGDCDPAEGKCTQCFTQGATGRLDTPALVRTNGLVVVPSDLRQSMPFSGEKLKCEEWFVKGMPVAGDTTGTEFQFTTESDTSTVCSGLGQPLRNAAGMAIGACICPEPRFGQACEWRKCQMDSDQGPYFMPENPAVCHGRGVCNKANGLCESCIFSTGQYCEEKRCPGWSPDIADETIDSPECGSGVGQCDVQTGRCQCAQGASCGVVQDAVGAASGCPGACIYTDCQGDCGGSTIEGGATGKCDRFSGLCMCNSAGIFNGPACLIPSRGGQDSVGQVKTNLWTSTMDKWGWSICPSGYLLTGMKTDRRGSADALFNLDQGVCQRPFEANAAITRAVENYRCYHENWWKKFDSRGGKFCRRNYFVAGLFRSHCNSLYCIEMAKCCSVKRSLWTSCSWTPTTNWISNAAGMTVSGSTGFIVGFFRDALHTLAGITSLRQCSPIWYGQLYKYKTRFDN